MKKLLALLLCFVMVISLAACGQIGNSTGMNNGSTGTNIYTPATNGSDGNRGEEGGEEPISGSSVLVRVEEFYADGELYSGIYFTYDDNGRLTNITSSGNTSIFSHTYTYNDENYITQRTSVDSLDRTSTLIYDYIFENEKLTKLVAHWDGEDYCQINYSYHADGSLEMEYMDLVRGEDAGHYYQYDGNGNITHITREWDRSYTYETSLTYAANSLLTMTVDSDIVRNYEHDENGNLLPQEGNSVGDIELVYDHFGNIIRMEYPNGFCVVYTYETMEVPENLIPLMECITFEYTKCDKLFRYLGFLNLPYSLYWHILH